MQRKSYPRKNLSGMKFDMLTPIEWIRGGYWKYICDCGNEVIVDTRNLTSGHTRSCGCKRYEPKNFVDMTGYEDDNISVIKRDGSICGIAAWLCLCKHCGRKFRTKGSNIRLGYTTSCGCVHSINEQKIASMLIDKGVEFIPQYSFPDLIGIGGKKLRFDFAIFENGNLRRLLEFNGSQHYERPNGSWSENFDNQLSNDAIKFKYCKENNIDLKIIKYDEDYDISDILE